MKKILIATRNTKKKKELEKLLKDIDVSVLTLKDIRAHIPRVIEDGRTFHENAVKKALIFSRYADEMVLADDSGLAVYALKGRPGVRSSRFARANATDEENNAKLLALMKKIPVKKRKAVFVSCVAIAKKGVLLGTAEGRSVGSIGFYPKGDNGFGYDPLFTPKGYRNTFAQFKPSFKNRISHRGNALRKAKKIIQKFF